ncbi:M1 family aminopeptidase [Pseudoalteromonas sp. G4]|uniref:M1 family aminopeptidase n=1 Tax=Pseudoalteromonas sp. G4 TaxID=2992761 RepID=UPI00237E1258|nr:M1 family aminopeptidase [Pseudoalteromonas sp. G4]MDE3273944.1 M1 family aminopeptidase [Pseudoalteromonas sp. G4]
MLQFAFVPRKSGPSYSRDGFAVLTQSEDPTSPLFVKTLAHEVAHFWWNKAATDNWQDWLNESFAEFSALMAIEHIFGKEMKDKFLMEFESLSSTLSPLYQFQRSDKNVHNLMYKKGPVILEAFSANIKEAEFKRWLKMVSKGDITTTEKLFLLTEKAYGEVQRKYLEELLNK